MVVNSLMLCRRSAGRAALLRSPWRPRPAGGGRPRGGRARLRRGNPGRRGFAQFFADCSRASHRALDEGMLRVLREEQHHFATRALPGIAIPQPSRAIAEQRLAPRALNLDGTHADNNDCWKRDPSCAQTSEESLKAVTD